ncbi:MAG TPA: 3-hydroxyacyl-CoA dehydrogenase NAD-binding domain-containing protein [Chloroflexota bacterium]|nr:3-hydroxyacyl-CoA dehydrogenase NAD-binding domain-containing protein [Chloroflexota bacterium]
MTIDVPTPAAAETGVRLQIDGQTAVLILDQPGSTVNVINPAFIRGLEEAVRALPGSGATGVLIRSAKEGQFVAGADLTQIAPAPDTEEVARLARRFQRVLSRLAALPMTSVAVINGPALGGGLELALACDYRVAAETVTAIGLPEVSLGLLPAGGGTQRLPRLIGLSRALSLILEGQRLSARRAKRVGIVDEVVHPRDLDEAARSRLTRPKVRGPVPQSHLDRLAAHSALVRSVIYRQAARTVRARTKGHYPAPLRALDTVRAGLEQGFGAGLAAEAAAFGELAGTSHAHALISLFLAAEGLKREQRGETRPVQRVGVIGAGFMGAGIAQAGAVAGLDVRLRDTSPERVARGLKSARDLTLSAARNGRFTRPEAAAILSRLSGAADNSGMRRADLVIEAVFEDAALKRQVIAELEEILSPEAVIASNTSSLPIASLAEGARHPERILGMHFFSPVHKMPLLEIVRAPATSDDTVRAALQVGRRMGKTMIVVRDGPSFYTTRVLGFMLQEAGRIVEDGTPIADVDRAAISFGFPTGPLALIDEVGLDVAAHVSATLAAAFGYRFPRSASVDRMVAAGRLGRKSGRGFYDYSGRRKRPDPTLETGHGRPLPADLIAPRLALIFVNEAVRCLDEGIIASPRDGDVGAVLGTGFPPFLGGPFRHADALGPATVVEELRRMTDADGPQYEPADALVAMARRGRSFYGGAA